jgi:hypothetical protein
MTAPVFSNVAMKIGATSIGNSGPPFHYRARTSLGDATESVGRHPATRFSATREDLQSESIGFEILMDETGRRIPPGGIQ